MVGPSGSAAGRSALVVDDDRAVGDLLATFLRRLGFEVTVATTRDEAATHISGGGWSLLVTDLQIGGGGGAEGLELLAQARRDCPAAKTLLVSGSASTEIASTARDFGADIFLTKPVSFADFSQAVRSLLG